MTTDVGTTGKPKRYFKEPHSGTVVGYHDGAVYYTRRMPEIHFFRKLAGYGISYRILESCRFDGILLVYITELRASGRDRLLISKLDDWFRKSVRFDWHGDEQRILPIKFMKEESEWGLEPYTSYQWP